MMVKMTISFRMNNYSENKIQEDRNKTLKANIRNEIQRNRWNSDTSAWTRFKNILSEMNTKQEVNPFKLFSKQNFEIKNSISPRIMDNFVIDECHFGEEDNPLNQLIKSKDILDESEFNPFDSRINTIKEKYSDASQSQKSEVAQFKQAEFQGLREFRHSIDASGATSRSRMSPFHKTHRQKKFNLSFDGTVQPTNNEYGFLEDINNQQNVLFEKI